MSTTPARRDGDTPAVARLREIVAASAEANTVTRGGAVKPKTGKQREIEHAVANEVVRFAFDHAGITGGHLAPTGVLLDLLDGKAITHLLPHGIDPKHSDIARAIRKSHTAGELDRARARRLLFILQEEPPPPTQS